MFKLSDIDQRPYIMGWHKVAFESLCRRTRRPGQALALAGEAALAEAFAAKAMAYFEGLSALFGAGEGLDTGFSMI